MMKRFVFLVWGLVFPGFVDAQPQSIATPVVPAECPPAIRILKPGVRLTEVVPDPAIVTPTGIDVDNSGQIWAVSSHTHFRPDDYAGPARDEVIVYSDQDQDGRFETAKVFYRRTEATMDLELGPGGWVYLAERGRILRVRDTDGDGAGDLEENIASLETTAAYPHNGHAGLAWHPSGDLIFALGENRSSEWTLSGRDGSKVQGTGEGGIFRCRPDGSKLRRIARGFWNPFGVVVRPNGEIFAAENDPGSRPPCRLLHIVEGGDYGYQRLYGPAPFHPFVAWNGELRGTLPMVSPVGEAPCGIAMLGGGLIVPSWADNRIDFFPLAQKGASYTAERIELVIGSEFFRPTCIKQVSPTTYYLTDWVFGSYELHGRGRIWKLEIDPQQAGWLSPRSIPGFNDAAQLARRLRSGTSKRNIDQLFQLAHSEDPFIAHGAVLSLSASARFWDVEAVRRMTSANRVVACLALRQTRPRIAMWPRKLLRDSDQSVVFEALRWIADERLPGFEDDVQTLLQRSDLGYQVFEAALACWNIITGNPKAGVADARMLLSRVRDEDSPPAIRAFALRLLPVNSRLTDKELLRLLRVNDPALSTEAVRSLAGRTNRAAVEILELLVDNRKLEPELRREAVSGLARNSEGQTARLVNLATEKNQGVRHEALRALRFMQTNTDQRAVLAAVADRYRDSRSLVRAVLSPETLAKDRPPFDDLSAWSRRLAKLKGDPTAGRRIFFHPKLALCSTCHRHGGSGIVLGPDLTAVSARNDRDWLLRSILQPNREVAPQFYPWSIETKDGEEFVGIMLRKGGRSGKEFYRDPTGREKSIVKSDVVNRRELKTSLMPEGLLAGLTDQEIADLLAFLQQR